MLEILNVLFQVCPSNRHTCVPAVSLNTPHHLSPCFQILDSGFSPTLPVMLKLLSTCVLTIAVNSARDSSGSNDRPREKDERNFLLLFGWQFRRAFRI